MIEVLFFKKCYFEEYVKWVVYLGEQFGLDIIEMCFYIVCEVGMIDEYVDIMLLQNDMFIVRLDENILLCLIINGECVEEEIVGIGYFLFEGILYGVLFGNFGDGDCYLLVIWIKCVV